MNTGRIVAIVIGVAALGGAGYLYWKKKQGEDEGYGFEGEPSKIIKGEGYASELGDLGGKPAGGGVHYDPSKPISNANRGGLNFSGNYTPLGF